ncbi:MAG: aldehyde dehydrogenase family protein, partial [Micromonosporaceae bacterium]
MTRAAAAAPAMASWSGAYRRDLLYASADALAAAADEVVSIAVVETGHAETLLRGEMDRTTGQLRLFGDFVAGGRHRTEMVSPGAAADGADVVNVPVPVGPVAVFAASNLPLAFGVAGGDTASALAAGCPVVVKAHPAQPETSRRIADLLAATLPDGAFGMVEGGAETSLALVRHPAIRAVGFTGSLAGGRALMDAAAARTHPIPVYAEMGSLNPMFVLPAAAADQGWADTIAGSVTRACGQLCTKPGLVVLPDTDAGRALADTLAAAVAASATYRMLTPAMAEAHQQWLTRAGRLGDVTAGTAEPPPFAVRVTPAALRGELLDEHFGPAVVLCLAPEAAYPDIVSRLSGSLTATVVA